MILSKLVNLHKFYLQNKFFIYKLINFLKKKIKLHDLLNIFLSFKKNKIFIIENTFLLNNIVNKVSPVNFYGNNLINFILNIKITKNNIYFNIADIKGHTKFLYSASSVIQDKKDLLKEKKQTQKLLVNMLKFLINKTKFIQKKVLAIHFTGTKIFQETFITNVIKKVFLLQYIKSFNSFPYNGCRPKKIKKVKVRTKRLKLSIKKH